MQRRRRLVTLIAAVAALTALALAVRAGVDAITPPAPIPMDQMPVLGLPEDPAEARYVVQIRTMGDRLAGMPEEAVRRRHEERLKILGEVTARAANGPTRKGQ